MKLISICIMILCFCAGSLRAMEGHNEPIADDNKNYGRYVPKSPYHFEWVFNVPQEDDDEILPEKEKDSFEAMNFLCSIIDRKCKKNEERLESTTNQMSIGFLTESAANGEQNELTDVNNSKEKMAVGYLCNRMDIEYLLN